MAEQISFQITNDLAPLREFEIEANFEEVSKWLDENLEPYRTMVVTEDVIPVAKAYRANIRKVKENIEQYRKSAKKAALAAYERFEPYCKELTAKCDEAIENLDKPVKAFEEQKKQQKKLLLEAYFNGKAGEAEKYLTFEDIFSERWLNTTVRQEEAEAEIDLAISTVLTDISAIKALHSKYEAALIDHYMSTRSLSSCIEKNALFMKLDEARARFEKAKEDGKIAVEETEELKTVQFEITVTAKQLKELGAYMRENGIKAKRIGG